MILLRNLVYMKGLPGRILLLLLDRKSLNYLNLNRIIRKLVIIDLSLQLNINLRRNYLMGLFSITFLLF